MVAKSKINSVESKISEALTNNEISYKNFMIIINEETKYRELKESAKMMNTQRSDVKKITWLKKAKKQVLIKLISPVKLLITA